jgi:metallo-beta-lactamase family protein
MKDSLTFLGAAGTVTGSRYLLATGECHLLVDCGLFQGLKQLRLRNWAPFYIKPANIDAVLLTHAHLDHSGYLPALVRDGYEGTISATPATIDYCKILLPDSGYLQEKDAEFANRHGFSKHRPALPLYTLKDAERVLPRFRPASFGAESAVIPGVDLHPRRTGHILGAASLDLRVNGRRVVFSGDLGRYDDPVMKDPEPIPAADYLIIESTYGNRRHDRSDPGEALAKIIDKTVRRGGTVIIPAFAVGRAQSLLFHLDRLQKAGKLGRVPVYLDSPMAIDASELLCQHLDDHRLTPEVCRGACGIATYVRSVEDSKALTTNRVPKVIVSASGMATGGRVLHHLKSYAPDPRSTIVLAGFQAAGTRGAALLDGAESIRIHGSDIPVRAEVVNLPMLSAHADADEILRWLRGFSEAPRRTFITHGEPAASDALRQRIERELGWSCHIPEQGEKVELI